MIYGRSVGGREGARKRPETRQVSDPSVYGFASVNGENWRMIRGRLAAAGSAPPAARVPGLSASHEAFWEPCGRDVRAPANPGRDLAMRNGLTVYGRSNANPVETPVLASCADAVFGRPRANRRRSLTAVPRRGGGSRRPAGQNAGYGRQKKARRIAPPGQIATKGGENEVSRWSQHSRWTSMMQEVSDNFLYATNRARSPSWRGQGAANLRNLTEL